jgi:DNA invertase Pin-like site-specific DNA recombinase
MKKNYNSHPTPADELSLKSRSRQELAEAYGVSTRTFRRWLKRHHITLPNGLVKPQDIRKIYASLGPPK